MAIRLSSSCQNCSNLESTATCQIHGVKVSSTYTCDQFSMKFALSEERQCTNCARHQTDTCAHPDKAAEGMLCTSWAPAAVA